MQYTLSTCVPDSQKGVYNLWGRGGALWGTVWCERVGFWATRGLSDDMLRLVLCTGGCTRFGVWSGEGRCWWDVTGTCVGELDSGGINLVTSRTITMDMLLPAA